MKKTIARAAFAVTICAMLMLSGCGKSYEYTYGDLKWDSTYNPDKTISDTYYYSDDWFSDKPAEQNDELALASIQLTAAAVSDDPNGYGAEFLKSMGFDEVGFSDFKSTDPDDCNYTWGRKTLSDGTSLVAVVIQSKNWDPAIKLKAWKQNATVNDPDGEPSGEHFAFAKAVDKVVDDIASLADTDKVKFWITGSSRGGALANILAARLPEKLGDKNGGIFAYTFESPNTVDEETASGGEYNYIHNYVCSDDIVTMIPPWGMTRYGVTHDLKTKDTDEGMVEELTKLGSDAADYKARIVVSKDAEALAANCETRIPSRADYSASVTDNWTDEDGEHEITYNYQDAVRSLMDLVIGDGSSDFEIKSLASKKNDLTASADHLTAGIRLENEGKDPFAEYWTGAKGMHDVIESIMGEGKSPVSVEDIYKILRIIAPVMIEVPEDGGDASTELLTDVIGYGDDLTYSHHFDTLIARLKVLAPAPQQ